MKIVLIGFMGSGKSTVAPLLAKRLELEAIEMDDLITEQAGKDVKSIFAAGGERAFRELETAVAQELRQRDNVVISTGGGVVTSPPAMQALSQQATIVELTGSFQTLFARLSPNASRPLFADREQAHALYEKRRPLYSQYATLQIATDNKSVTAVAETVAAQLRQVAPS